MGEKEKGNFRGGAQNVGVDTVEISGTIVGEGSWFGTWFGTFTTSIFQMTYQLLLFGIGIIAIAVMYVELSGGEYPHFQIPNKQMWMSIMYDMKDSLPAVVPWSKGSDSNSNDNNNGNKDWIPHPMAMQKH